MAKVNVINQKKEQNISTGSIVSWNNDMYIVVFDYNYKLLNISTGVLDDVYYSTIKDLNKDNKIQLISNEIDIIIK